MPTGSGRWWGDAPRGFAFSLATAFTALLRDLIGFLYRGSFVRDPLLISRLVLNDSFTTFGDFVGGLSSSTRRGDSQHEFL